MVVDATVDGPEVMVTTMFVGAEESEGPDALCDEGHSAATAFPLKMRPMSVDGSAATPLHF